MLLDITVTIRLKHLSLQVLLKTQVAPWSLYMAYKHLQIDIVYSFKMT